MQISEFAQFPLPINYHSLGDHLQPPSNTKSSVMLIAAAPALITIFHMQFFLCLWVAFFFFFTTEEEEQLQACAAPVSSGRTTPVHVLPVVPTVLRNQVQSCFRNFEIKMYYRSCGIPVLHTSLHPRVQKMQKTWMVQIMPAYLSNVTSAHKMAYSDVSCFRNLRFHS